ncbi:MAG TPA: TIGR01777 family oxidoreductase [Planctomycetota bacterium]|nr:TIGR01777 family oxidoreductase [Planctomycetota bacterium]
MKLQEFAARTRVPVSAEEAYAWHARPGAFQRLSPPWQHVDVLEQGAGLSAGTRVVLRLRAGPLRRRWVAVHGPSTPGREFRDSAEHGPFAHWEHVHAFLPDGPGACWLEDRVRYALPWAALSQPLAGAFARGQLARLFRYRHATTAADLAAHAVREGEAAARPMRVLVSGASGLVGRQLVAFLSTGGHEVVRLQRAGTEASAPVAGAAADIVWDPRTGAAAPDAFEGFDAVVHLAGENLSARRWDADHKSAVRASRTTPTTMLARALGRCRRRPAVFACASAIGIYGDRGDALLVERSPPGEGFLPATCVAWEESTAPAADAGIRTLTLRLGIVLTPQGGALARMLPPFRLGAGGPLGRGRQWWSWISIDDTVAAIHHALRSETLRGPVNVVAPQPSPNGEFARMLGEVLRRPALLPVPERVLRQLLGEMADALLLSSTRVMPLALLDDGFTFRHPDLEAALRHLLGRRAP